MVQVDLSLAASLGAALAATGRGALRREPRLLFNRWLATFLALAAFFVVPALLFFLGLWPAWDTLYWWDPGELPGWLPAAVAFLVLGTGCTGFALVHLALRRGWDRFALALPALLVAPAAAILLLDSQRFLHVGSRASFAAGAPPNLLGSPVLWALLIVLPGWVGIPFAIVGARWERASRRA